MATLTNTSTTTSSMIRAARSLLGWSARELAEKSGVHLSTVQRFERHNGPVRGNVNTVGMVVGTLMEAGIEFENDFKREGVFLRRKGDESDSESDNSTNASDSGSSANDSET